nr:MAG TPA: hypothetical protein [Caudoviricetes sp.]
MTEADAVSRLGASDGMFWETFRCDRSLRRMLAGSLRGRFSCFCEKIDKKQPQGGADRCLLPPQSRGIYGAIATGNRLFRIRCAEHHPTLRILPARHYGPGENVSAG